MTDAKNKYQAYAAATQTVAKTRQIVMLYDGAIRFIRQAKEAIRDGRIEERYHLLIKTSGIIGGLQSCLDFENGGNVAKILYQFYSSIDGRLFSIHHNNSIESCDEIIADLKQMRDVWHDIDQNMVKPAEEKSAAVEASTVPGPAAAPVTFSA
jgi:flagellar protein FliS